MLFRVKYNLIYSYTDSMVYNIGHDDIYGWVGKHHEHNYLSDSLRSEIKCQDNNKLAGKPKYELHGQVIT